MLKFDPALEIKVALLGYVSVGKTTILNALLKDKFSEVSMRRGTAGINFFRISHRKKDDNNDNDNDNNDNNDKVNGETKELRPASSTLQEIVTDNATLRGTDTLQEKVFDVELEEPLCGEMRQDTKLVLVDTPGVNDAGSSTLYKEYVTKNWNSFDCVIVVMDGMQGVNTQEQLDMLDFVKTNSSNVRSIPVIVLCNKIDEPDDEEVASVVDEVRQKVEEVFEVTSRADSLNRVLETVKDNKESMYSLEESPAFIPISAVNAFLYRRVGGLSLDEFKKLDRRLIDKIGCNEVAQGKWRKYAQEKKYEVAYAAVSDASEYAERLETTNFDKFLGVLTYFVGGKRTQKVIIESHLKMAVLGLTWKAPLLPQLNEIYDRSRAVERPTESMISTFFRLYDDYRKHAESNFRDSMTLKDLNIAMDQLIDFVEDFNFKIHIKSDGTVDVEGRKTAEIDAIELMKDLVRFQCRTICEKLHTWGFGKTEQTKHAIVMEKDEDVSILSEVPQRHTRGQKSSKKRKSDESGKRTTPPTSKHKTNHRIILPTWEKLSPCAWNVLVGSILLLSHDKSFCECFGREKISLELRLSYVRHWIIQGGSFARNYLDEYKDGKSEERSSRSIKNRPSIQIEIPESLSNPEHWGHLAWKFCRFMSNQGEEGQQPT